MKGSSVNVLFSATFLLQELIVVVHANPCAGVYVTSMGEGCTCEDYPKNYDYPKLTCTGLTSPADLKNSIDHLNQVNVKLRTLIVEDSILHALPGGMFISQPIWYLHIYNTPLLSLKSPNNDLFKGAELSLTSIRISGSPYVRSWDFSETHVLQRIITILIDNCNIFHLVKRYIDMMPESLSNLIMRRNKIETIEPKAFVNSEIRTLDLDFNLLETIPDDIFPDTLGILYLRNNLLKSIPLNLFQNAKNLRYINLRNNQLHTLDMRAFYFIEKDFQNRENFELDLQGNNLECCSFTWLSDFKVKERITGMCEKPAKLRGLSISSMDENVKSLCRQY